ncbi:hypothetical protein B0T21DRAFT_63512 [Apiosordaria backusii]|uniref:DUF7689 domain-containing protein n=1 Tax=Apiosordaria backusii TaxID=314023 RepID=A0AA40AIL0_9PEZI|nr:hypothetical protein B0T21DRAFT_63512 [Apiosordaria backusii]
MATPEQVFHNWLISRFANAAANPTAYNIIPDTQTPFPNCFAYAVGVYDRAILPQTWDQLAQAYGEVGYYVTEDANIADGDVEVYAKPTDLNRPLHAHRITVAATETCESKMGGDFAIQHHRAFLQCNRPNSNQSEYGNAVTRYRYDAVRHKTWLEGETFTVSSKRKLKRKDVAYTNSGRPISKSKASRTKSGRIVKKGSTKKTTGATEVKSYKVSGLPDPKVLAKRPAPKIPAGGFKKPTAKIAPKSFAVKKPLAPVAGKPVKR